MSLLNRKRVILAKIEGTYGIDAAPTGALNSILVSNLNVTPQEANLVSRELIRPFFGNFTQLPAAISGKITFDVELAGAGTAGTAPAWGALLRACAFSESLLGTALSGSATAGSANSITLAAGASAVDGTYVGMHISLTSGTGSGQTGIIAGYNGATKVATMMVNWTTPPAAATGYTIAANAVYRPVTDNLEGATIYFNVDGVLHKFIGSRGSVAIKVPLWGIPKLSFSFTGTYTTPTDTAMPTAVFTSWQQPLTVNNTNTTGLVLAGYAGAVMSDFNLDIGNSVTYRSLVGGAQSVVLTDRKAAGDITVEATTVAAKDWWTASQNATLSGFTLAHGTTAGNTVQMSCPQLQIVKPTYEDKDGVAMLKASLFAVPLSQNDEVWISAR